VRVRGGPQAGPETGGRRGGPNGPRHRCWHGQRDVCARSGAHARPRCAATGCQDFPDGFAHGPTEVAHHGAGHAVVAQDGLEARRDRVGAFRGQFPGTEHPGPPAGVGDQEGAPAVLACGVHMQRKPAISGEGLADAPGVGLLQRLQVRQETASVLRFAVVLEWDEEGQGWTVTMPAIAGCFTQGHSVEEALRRAEDAIRLNLEDMAVRGQPLPRPDAVRVETVSVPAPAR